MGRPLALLAALLVVESVALLGRSSGGRSLYRPAALGAARGRIACLGSKPPAATGGVATHLVWFTGGADLRLHDHAGLSAAAKAGARVVPVFVLDDELVLGMPESTVRRLHSALAGLDGELEAAYGGRLVFRQGSAGKVLAELAREAKATVCHVIADEVTFHHKAARARARTALEKAGVETRLWTTCLRPDAPWSSAGAALTRLPGTYGEYFQTARTLDIAAPAPAPASVRICAPPKGGSLPACGAMLEATDARAGAAARARTAFPTTEPFDHVVSGWCTTRSARAALDEYVQIGRARFADRHFYEAMPLAPFAAPASNAAVAAELLAEPADAALDADAPAPARVGSAAQAAVAYTEADAERSELQRPGVRVGMAEGALETGVPVGPRASGVGSVEAVDRLVPVGSANAAELWAGATAADAAAVDGAAAAAAADYEPSFALAPPSLHAAAAQWVLPHVPRGGTPGGGDGAAERPEAGVVGGRLAAREVATRTLAPALSLGVLSAREVAHATLAAAAAAGGARSATLSGQAWGRSDLGALNDVLEWREWHRLLARRDLEVQRARAPGSKSGAAPLAEPDAAVAVAAGQSAADAVGADAQPPPPPQAQPASGAGAAARAAPPRVEAVAAIAAEVAAQARAGVEGLPPAARRDELAREVPAYGYWRWGGQHLIRFAVWPSDADVRALGGRADVGADGESLLEAERLLDALASEADAGAQPRAGADAEPALLFVHGFGASAEQWCRLARQTRAQMRALGMRVPRMYALDLIGFGHSEKPGLSYTQHLWEASLVDFALEVMRGRTFVAVGNSIGGGLSSGLAANLRGVCRGLVLCNSAGSLDTASEYAERMSVQLGRSVGEQTLVVRDHPTALRDVYAPPAVGGQSLLDAFGYVLIQWLLPQVGKLLKTYYPSNPEAVDELLINAIARDGSDPGAANVIASGQKLPPQRPLNEVLTALHGFGGPVLVPQGALDPLSGAKRSQERARTFGTLREGVTVKMLNAGHCPHDEVPAQVARALVEWWPSVLSQD